MEWTINGAYVGAHGEAEQVEDDTEAEDDEALLLAQGYPLIHDGRADRLNQCELQPAETRQCASE